MHGRVRVRNKQDQVNILPLLWAQVNKQGTNRRIKIVQAWSTIKGGNSQTETRMTTGIPGVVLLQGTRLRHRCTLVSLELCDCVNISDKVKRLGRPESGINLVESPVIVEERRGRVSVVIRPTVFDEDEVDEEEGDEERTDGGSQIGPTGKGISIAAQEAHR